MTLIVAAESKVVSPVYWNQTTMYTIQERVEVVLMHVAIMSAREVS